MTMERGSLLNKRYRIVEILGQGGMASVYRAIDENLGLEVAVKENLFTTEEYARQFRLEATILANMRQPNLPRVSDHFVIEHQGQYLVMDYIEGEDLRQRMDRIGPLPEQEVIVLGVAICDALAYMHSRKPMILHRDIKPGNVRITPQGHIYLVDFGLAKVVQGREATSTGARAMTPGYSPPEQYGTARTDPRSDIYSLGATLYSALTDNLPEDGLARAMDQAQLTPILQLNPRVSRRIAMVVEKCLEVRPDDRYQSAEELKPDLLEARSTTRRKLPIDLVLPPPPLVLQDGIPRDFPEEDEGIASLDDESAPDGEGMLAPPGGRSGERKYAYPVAAHRPRRRSGFLWFLIILLLILLTGTVAYLLNPNLPDQALAWFITSASPTLASTVPTTTLTPQLIVVDTATQSITLTPTSTATVSPTPLPSKTPSPNPTDTIAPPTTPLGGGLGQIAFASDRSGSAEIWLVNVDGSGLKRLTDIGEGACQPRWSPDGLRIVFISPCPKDQMQYPGASLFIMNADGSGLIPLPIVPGGDFDPTWSPDGQKIAFTTLRNGGMPEIAIVNLKDYSITSLLDPENKSNSQPAWSPDGKHIAYVGADNRIWSMTINGSMRHGLSIGGGDYVNSFPAWSSDGTVVVFTRRKEADATSAYWMASVPYTEDGALVANIPNSDLAIEASYSPDGFWLVFKSWMTGNHDIYIMRSNGVNKQAIVTSEAYDFDPAWRPVIIEP